MRKISEMYRISGGTSGKHRCAECSNLIRQKQNKRTICKCRIYSEICDEESDWRKSYPACAWFNQERNKGHDVHTSKDQMPRQMNIFDFIEMEEAK